METAELGATRTALVHFFSSQDLYTFSPACPLPPGVYTEALHLNPCGALPPLYGRAHPLHPNLPRLGLRWPSPCRTLLGLCKSIDIRRRHFHHPGNHTPVLWTRAVSCSAHFRYIPGSVSECLSGGLRFLPSALNVRAPGAVRHCALACLYVRLLFSCRRRTTYYMSCDVSRVVRSCGVVCACACRAVNGAAPHVPTPVSYWMDDGSAAAAARVFSELSCTD
jgi:hypothetical protein